MRRFLGNINKKRLEELKKEGMEQIGKNFKGT